MRVRPKRYCRLNAEPRFAAFPIEREHRQVRQRDLGDDFMRYLIFTVLFPPIALMVYIMADGLWREGLPGIGFLAYLAIAYALSIVPPG